MIRIALFALRELHVPCLLPVFQVLSKQPNVEVGFLTSKVSNNPSQVPFEGLRENFIQSLAQSGKPFWGTNPEGNAFDCVVTADFCAEWIEGWGPSVCVGHGTISKNIYFTPNPTARRESYHDALCVPGPWFANSFGHFVKTRIVPTGFPKMDEYAVGAEKIAALRRELGFRPDRIHVLLAPTFNPEFSALPVAEEALKRIDTSSFHLQIKLHGATDPTTAQRIRQLCASKDGLTLSDSASVAPLLLAADIIITDVSSILLEAIANNKKVIAINNPRRFGFSLYQPDCVEFRFRDATYEVWDPTALLETLQLLCSSDPKQALREQTAHRLFGTQDGRNAERAAKVILEVANGIETRPCPFQSIIVQPDASSPHAIANLLWNLASRRWKQIPVVATDHATAATLKHLDRAAGLGLTILESTHHLLGEYTLLLTGEHYFPKDWDYAFAVSTDFLEQNLPRVLAPCLLGSVNPFQRPEFLNPDLKATVESAQSARPAAIEFQRRTKYRLFHESHTIPVALPDGCLFPANQLSPELLAHLKTRRELPPNLFHPMSGLAAPRALPSIIGIPGAWNSEGPRGTSSVQPAANTPQQAPPEPVDMSPPFRRALGIPSNYLVSAIISTYRSEKFIRGRLENLLTQSIASQIEIIVIDSGSPENEGTIVREFESRFPNVRYIRTPERETIYAAWNRGIEAARGKYLTNANTDDRLRSDAIETLVKALESNPSLSVAYGRQFITNEPNQTFENAKPVGAHDWPQVTRENILINCNAGSQPLWRRSLHDEFGLFDATLEIAGDYEFWIRCCLGGVGFLLIPERLGLYYKALDGTNKEFQNRLRTFSETYTIQRRNLIKTLEVQQVHERVTNLEHSRISITQQLDTLKTGAQVEHATRLRLEHTFWETAVSLETLGRIEDSRNLARSFFDVFNDSYKLAFHLRDISNRPAPIPPALTGPLVSVIVPCFNCETTVEKTLQSLLNQSYQRLELLFVDDGSSDGTAGLIAAFIANHPALRCTLLQQANRGPAVARNSAAKNATGEFLLFVDSDDELAWDFVSECVKTFEINPSLDVVFTEAVFFGAKNKIWALQEVSLPALYCFNQLTVTSLVRRDTFTRAGGFDEDLLGYEDWNLWISLAKSGAQFRHLRKPLFLYRHSTGSRNYQANRSDRAIKLAIIARHPDIYRQPRADELGLLDAPQQIPPKFLRESQHELVPSDQKTLGQKKRTPNQRRILFVCHDFPPYKYAGAQLYTFELAKELIALGEDVWVFHPVDISKMPPETQVHTIEQTAFQGVGIYRIAIDEKGKFGPFDPFFSKAVEDRFRELLEREHFDLVHFHLLFRLSATLPLVTKSLGIPTIATLHDYWLLCSTGHMIDTRLRECSGPETTAKCAQCSTGFKQAPSPNALKYFETRRSVALEAYRHIDHVISPSQFLADTHANFGFPRPSILPLGWIPVRPHPRNRTSGSVILGYCGQVIIRKGLDILLKALIELPKNLDWKLCVHGEVYEPDYKSQVLDKLADDPRIEFKGGYTTSDLSGIYSGVDVAIMPSRRENYPLTVLEALSAGVPVVASDVGGVREMMTDGVEGRIFRNGDVANLSEILRNLLENPAQITRFKQGIRPIKTIQQNAVEVRNIYLSSCAAKPPGQEAFGVLDL